MTRVVNVSVKHLRANGYDNIEQWLADSDSNVYVGRRMRIFVHDRDKTRRVIFLPDSPFANRFKVAALGREEALRQYEQDLRQRLEQQPDLRAKLETLRGKTLGCWCAPEPCHAHILAQMLDEKVQ